MLRQIRKYLVQYLGHCLTACLISPHVFRAPWYCLKSQAWSTGSTRVMKSSCESSISFPEKRPGCLPIQQQSSLLPQVPALYVGTYFFAVFFDLLLCFVICHCFFCILGPPYNTLCYFSKKILTNILNVNKPCRFPSYGINEVNQPDLWIGFLLCLVCIAWISIDCAYTHTRTPHLSTQYRSAAFIGHFENKIVRPLINFIMCNSNQTLDLRLPQLHALQSSFLKTR